MKAILLSAFFLVFNFVATAQENFATISNGGGFAGTATVYKVCRDGKILKGNGFSPLVYTQEATLKRSKAKKYLKRISALIASLSDFNHPGNMYYSMAIVEKGIERKIVWGDNKKPAPENVLKLYNEMVLVLSHLSFEKNTPK